MKRVLIIVCSVVLAAHGAVACPSCYGAGANGPMVDGMNTAILFMLGITGVMLAAITFFFIMMRRRSRRLFDHSPGTAFLNEQGIIQWKSY